MAVDESVMVLLIQVENPAPDFTVNSGLVAVSRDKLEDFLIEAPHWACAASTEMLYECFLRFSSCWGSTSFSSAFSTWRLSAGGVYYRGVFVLASTSFYWSSDFLTWYYRWTTRVSRWKSFSALPHRTTVHNKATSSSVHKNDGNGDTWDLGTRVNAEDGLDDHSVHRVSRLQVIIHFRVDVDRPFFLFTFEDISCFGCNVQERVSFDSLII